MQESNVAIVILNYLNYKDTIECVDSILKNKYAIKGVVVVDNGSTNNSFNIISDKYIGNKDIHILKSQKNLGYAKGNNLGISYARKRLSAEFVLVVNNDTVFGEEDYLDKLLSKYHKGIGCIGSKIILKNGIEQAEYSECISAKDTFWSLVNLRSQRDGSSFDFCCNEDGWTYILHGSAILLTPDFFKYYEGFYQGTFLYGEEAILYYMCKCKGIQQLYVPEASIYHKEDQSSIMSFNNDSEIMEKYVYQSRKYVLFWALKSKCIELLRSKKKV